MKNFFVLSLIALATVAFTSAAAVNAATFNPNHIIDNSLFTATGSMSQTDIQNFLNSQGGFLANWTDNVDVYYYTGNSSSPLLRDTSGNVCLVHKATGQSAAQIIYQAATDFAAQYVQWYDTNGNPVGHDYTGAIGSCGAQAKNITYLTDNVATVSPKIILTTLQKEQALVSSAANWDPSNTNPNDPDGYIDPSCGPSIPCYSQYALDWATGYGVPDAGGKNQSYKGFYNQVNFGAWQLRFNYERSAGNTAWDGGAGGCYGGYMTQGTFATCPGGGTVSYSGYATIDNTSVYMSNQATASLYTYTPHLSGNQHFVNIWSGWFGSLQSAYMARGSSNPQVYLVDNGTKYPVNNTDILNAYGVFGSVQTVDQNYLDGLSTGYTLGHIGQDPNSSAIYLIDSGQKIQFSSCAMMANFGYACSAPQMPADVFSGLSTSSAMVSNVTRGNINPSLYEMINGQRHYIPDSATLSAYGLNSSAITFLADSNLFSFPESYPLVPDQSIVIDGQNGNVFLYLQSANQARWVPNTSLFQDWGFSSRPQYSFPDYAVVQYPRGNDITPFAQDSGNNKYLIDSGLRRPLGSDAGDWGGAYTTGVPDSLINAITAGSDPGTLIKGSDNSAVYLVQSTKKRLIPSSDDLVRSGYSFNSVVTLRPTTIASLPTGITQFGSLRLLKQSASNAVQMVDDGAGTNASWLIPSPTIAASFGLNLNSVWTVDSATFTAYPSGGNLGFLVTDGTNKYLADSGQLYNMNSVSSSYGYTSNQFTTLGSLAINNLAKGPNLTIYIKGSGSTIYEVNSGSKDPFASYQAYVNAGGTSSNTLTLSDWFLGTLPTGSPLY